MKKNKPVVVSTFTYSNQDLEILYHRGMISYTFNIGDKRYGNKVKVEGNRKGQDIVNASFALIINFIETYDRITKK